MNRLMFLFILILLSGLAIFWGCGKDRSPLDSGKNESGETGAINFEVTYAPWKPLAAKPAAEDSIDRATVWVYDENNTELLTQNLEIGDGRAKGSLTVRAQKNVRVTLGFFRGETVDYLGETVVDVPARSSVTAHIIEQYMGTAITVPDSALVGQDYQISWMSRPFVQWYEVMESLSPEFGDSWSIYNGADTTFTVAAKGEYEALKTYYYRARAVTVYGPGPWHGQGNIGINGEDGTIIIDIPLPPDVPLGGSAIKLTSPVGGETFTAGSIRNIEWTSSGVSRVKIEYSRDLGMTWLLLAASLDAATGSWPWTLPSESIPACLVRVSDAADPKIVSKTLLPFSIMPQTSPQTLILAIPNGGETFAAETAREIVWTSRGVDEVNVEFSRDGGKTWISLAMNISATPGKFAWNVPDLPSTSCFVRVRSAADTLVSDASDQKFTLTTTAPSVTVLSPNGGETFDGFSYIPITWKSTGIDNVQIEYSTDGGTTWKTGPYAATQSWQVNQSEWFSVNESSTRCMIRIRDYGKSYASDASDLPFTLNQITRSITITSPQNGSILNGDTVYSLSWIGKGARRDNFVRADYYDYNRWWQVWLANNSTTVDLNEEGWFHIGTGNAAGDAISFRTPAVHDSLYTYFRFMKAASDYTYDYSSFGTVPCKVTILPVKYTITLTSPNGGESWKEGTTQAITWESNYSDSVRVDLSRDGGVSWKEITRTKGYDKKIDWTVPNIPSANCLFRVTDTKYTEVTDRSDAVFTLLGASGDAIVTITSPNGGETWEVGSKQKITWTSQSVSKVNIEVSSDGGKTWFALATNITASIGSYEGTVPNRISTNCMIRVSDSTNSKIKDVGGPLTIDSKYTPKITVLNPGGGVNWRTGKNQVITWSSTDVRMVRIDYSIDGGKNWSQIVERTDASRGFQIWKAPSTLSSTQCLVRVTDTYNTQISGQSSAVFGLSSGGISPSLILVSPKGDEQYTSGTTQTISWKHFNAVKIKLELSRDEGANWTTIATNLDPGTTVDTGTQYSYLGSYSWKVSDIISSDKCKIRISDVYNPELGNMYNLPAIMIFNPSITMVSIAGGEFSMGSLSLNEQPVHRVKVGDFLMSATKITTLQYDTVTAGYDQGYPYNLKPVWDAMNWEKAAGFCNKLSDRAGLQRCYNETTWACDYTKNGYRLPTEAEWEYACRAGSLADPTTSELNNIAWTDWFYSPHVVAAKKPNDWGLYDMLGNVFEWCNDRWGMYSRDYAVDPTGPATGDLHVIRGGAFWNYNDVRPSWRCNWNDVTVHMVQTSNGYPPSSAAFRVVRKQTAVYAKETP